ncbi:hypothetical protein HB364_12945 [Pseudoflavitalea sp. X16]|uniref:hypothetical protein n=1 Tax=Paraflavitalea devenefica TaxID=2716334 RepID=UPI00142380DB|nr:hypothetical protein [Paraflavitalea devenefica]NII25995.1 hypothetical protein [Paraflavitalea devenefica]
MNKHLTTLFFGSLLLLTFSCKKSDLAAPQAAEAARETPTKNANRSVTQGRFNGTYVDTWHYSTPQLYIFKDSLYARYDILTNTFMGTNTIAAGYAGVPFATIDAAYVDTWHYSTPQLYLFSGNQYARYDILTNTFMGTGPLSAYTGVPFSSIDAAYVDTWHYSTPQLYLFKGSQYARYDILTNTFMGTNSIAAGYAGVPFSSIDATYVDTWHYSTPQLYLFSGNDYARYDILSNTFMGTNSISAGYAGVPF